MTRRVTTMLLASGMLLVTLIVTSQLTRNTLRAQPTAGAPTLRGPIVINLPADDVEKTVKFYSDLLGIEFARTLTEAEESYHAPLNDEGLQLEISKSNKPNDPITPYFAVDDLTRAVQQFNQNGGKTIVEPFDLAIPKDVYPEFSQLAKGKAKGLARQVEVQPTLGKAAIVLDPAGRQIGLIELADYAGQVFFTTRGVGAERRKDHQQSIELGKKLRKGGR